MTKSEASQRLFEHLADAPIGLCIHTHMLLLAEAEIVHGQGRKQLALELVGDAARIFVIIVGRFGGRADIIHVDPPDAT
jgi:hypothetical protein